VIDGLTCIAAVETLNATNYILDVGLEQSVPVIKRTGVAKAGAVGEL